MQPVSRIGGVDLEPRRRELSQMLLQAKGNLAELQEAAADALAVVHRIEGGLTELSEQERRQIPKESDET